MAATFGVALGLKSARSSLCGTMGRVQGGPPGHSEDAGGLPAVGWHGDVAGAVELVQGEIVSKLGTSLPHSMAAQRILAWLKGVFPSSLILPTCSIDVAREDNPTSEPEPDIALLVEVSDTTLDHDLGPKARLYARAGIVDYWVVDIKGGRVHQHREPGAGCYSMVLVYEVDAALSPLARPDATVTVKALALG